MWSRQNFFLFGGLLVHDWIFRNHHHDVAWGSRMMPTAMAFASSPSSSSSSSNRRFVWGCRPSRETASALTNTAAAGGADAATTTTTTADAPMAVSPENMALLSERGRLALQSLVQYDADTGAQAHVYGSWPEAGTDDDHKRRLAEQVSDVKYIYICVCVCFRESAAKAKKNVRERIARDVGHWLRMKDVRSISLTKSLLCQCASPDHVGWNWFFKKRYPIACRFGWFVSGGTHCLFEQSESTAARECRWNQSV